MDLYYNICIIFIILKSYNFILLVFIIYQQYLVNKKKKTLIINI